MKKNISGLLLTCVMLLSLAACGSSDAQEVSSDASSDADETAAEETSEEDTASDITFESLTVVDNEECAIVITGIDPDGLWGYTLEAEFENKSSDITYMFSVETASVNGLQADPYFADTVAAGKKAIESIYFDTDTLDEYGVGTITDISVSFLVYDEDDWSADYVAEETVHIYPYGEENAAVFVRDAQETDETVVDTDEAVVTVTGFAEDDIWGYEMQLYLENNTDQEIMFSIEDASVNGYMADPYWAEILYPSTCAITSVYWYEETLEEIGITDPSEEVEEVEFTIIIYDMDTYDTLFSQLVTLNP